MALTKIQTAGIADDAIDSDHYANASIDNAHLADDAVGVAELSATGTASSSTYLRGDNAWTAAASYETGTWTPAFAGSGTAGSFTYTAQIGHYTKIGNVVVAQFRVSINAIGTAAAGYLYIQGLPENAYEYPGITFSSIVGFTSGDVPSGGYMQNATNYMQLMRYDAADARTGWNTHCGGTALTTSSAIAGSITYRTSAT